MIRCSARDCPHLMPRDGLLCSECWRSLPEPIREEVADAYYSVTRGRVFGLWTWRVASRKAVKAAGYLVRRMRSGRTREQAVEDVSLLYRLKEDGRCSVSRGG